jgi:two-component system response regulator HydG
LAVILVAEDDRDFRELLTEVFKASGYEVDEARDGGEAVELVRRKKYDVVVSDVQLPVKDGMELLEESKFISSDTEVIIITAYGTMDSAVEAMKKGAFDYLQKPFSIPELEMRVERALSHRSLVKEVTYLRREQDVIYRLEDIVGESEAIQGVLSEVKRLADEEANVLVSGETGSGRHLIAGAIHFNSDRRDRGFIRVNCAGKSDDYIQSDLFGHVKGTRDWADKARIGRIEQASGGTIFIEEIGEASPGVQEKLLEFLNTGSFQRMGGERTILVNARVIASTSRDLEKDISSGTFNPELYASLTQEHILMPPLRDRGEDIRPLALYFMRKLREELDNGRSTALSDDAMAKLCNYNWPGNVRELKNVLERSLLASDEEVLDAAHIQLPGDPPDAALSDRKLKELEKEAVLEALEKTNYVQKDAAKLLGISKRVIHYKIQQFGIKHPRWIKNK